MRQLNRAEFLRIFTVVAGSALLGCGDDEPSDNDDGGGSSNTTPTATGAGGSGGSGMGGAGTGGTGGQAGSCGLTIDAQITCREGHSLVISVEDLMAAQTKTYEIRGTNSSHGHSVTVTGDMFAQLLAGETVEIFVPSSVLPHTVFIKCEGLDPGALDAVDC
jgi:hypothetical protein